MRSHQCLGLREEMDEIKLRSSVMMDDISDGYWLFKDDIATTPMAG